MCGDAEDMNLQKALKFRRNKIAGKTLLQSGEN